MEETPRALDCGRTVEELSDYLASGRIPRDSHIESCPECLNALQGLDSVSQLSRDLIARDAVAAGAIPETWIKSIMTNIQNEVRSGRSLPLHHPDARVSLSITEGAVRALIRSVGDDIPGIVVGKSEIIGDVEREGAPVEVTITASVAWGQPIAEATSVLRDRVFEALARHTELDVVAVNVTVEDLHVDAVQEGR